VGVAPHRFTESTVSDAPKADLDATAASGAATTGRTSAFAAGDAVAAPVDDAAEGRAVEGPVEGATGGAVDGAVDGTVANGAAEDLAVNGAVDGAVDGQAVEEQEAARSARKPRRRRARPEYRRPMLILCVTFSVLVVALAAIAVKLGLGLQGQQRQQADQQAALHAARQAAADLMTIKYQTAGNDINRILGVATGSFHAQVSGDRKQLVNETESAHAVSTANVLGAGLVGGAITGNTATVVVVVDSTITSKNAPNGVVNHYRETVTLTRTGGRWLASQVDFATPSGGQ
jgi:Mce-associated membrane protein